MMDARRIKEIVTGSLLSMIVGTSARAGPNVVIDPVAVRILARSKIVGYVVDGRNIENLEDVLRNREFIGTKIIP